jgi:hypothetical protein
MVIGGGGANAMKTHGSVKDDNVSLKWCEIGEKGMHLIITNNSMASVHGRTIMTERPPLVGKVSAHFCG